MTRIHCSFCGKASNEVKHIIAGPGVFICDECVALSVRVLQERGMEVRHVKYETVSVHDAVSVEARKAHEALEKAGQLLADAQQALASFAYPRD